MYFNLLFLCAGAVFYKNIMIDNELGWIAFRKTNSQCAVFIDYDLITYAVLFALNFIILVTSKNIQDKKRWDTLNNLITIYVFIYSIIGWGNCHGEEANNKLSKFLWQTNCSNSDVCKQISEVSHNATIMLWFRLWSVIFCLPLLCIVMLLYCFVVCLSG